MIVVTTPTGTIGRQVLGHSVDSGQPIRVITRDPSRLPAHTLERVEFVQGPSPPARPASGRGARKC